MYRVWLQLSGFTYFIHQLNFDENEKQKNQNWMKMEEK